MISLAAQPPAFSSASSDGLPIPPAPQAAQAKWAATPIRERLRVLRAFRHRVAARSALFTEALSHLPRTAAQALVSEVLPLAEACRFLERRAAAILKPVRLGRRGRPAWLGSITAVVEPAPLGRVLIVGPSNYPLFLVGVQVLQALAAGNAVLVKPGRGGMRAAEVLRQALVEAGLPAELLQVLPEETASVLAALEAGVQKVFLTGSFATGQRVLALLAPRAIPAVMELSGCDAAILLPSWPAGRFIAALRFGLSLNHGQTCIAPRRAYVPRAVLGQVENGLLQALKGVPAGPVDAATHQRIRTLVREAQQSGARLLTPLAESPGSFSPAVLSDVPAGAALLREDVFAPLVSLVGYDERSGNLAEVVNRCPYALGASIFGPEGAAQALARQLAAGTVTINDLIAPTADPRLPFAPGPGSQSGFGTTRGPQGLLEMTTPRTRIVRHGGFLPHLELPAPEDERLFTCLLRAVHGGSARLRNVCGLVRMAGGRRAASVSSPSLSPPPPPPLPPPPHPVSPAASDDAYRATTE